MEIELTEKEDERGQNKDQTAYHQQNSSQTVENGEREQPASRQSSKGQPPHPRLALEIMTHRRTKESEFQRVEQE